jgi:hypothetical protein
MPKWPDSPDFFYLVGDLALKQAAADAAQATKPLAASCHVRMGDDAWRLASAPTWKAVCLAAEAILPATIWKSPARGSSSNRRTRSLRASAPEFGPFEGAEL